MLMSSDKMVKLSETAHHRLQDYKNRFEHKSFDSAVRELIAENERLSKEVNE